MAFLILRHLSERHLSERHLSERHLSETTFVRKDICQKRHLSECDICQKQHLSEYLFRALEALPDTFAWSSFPFQPFSVFFCILKPFSAWRHCQTLLHAFLGSSFWSEAHPGPEGATDKVQLWSEPEQFGPKGLPRGLVIYFEL